MKPVIIGAGLAGMTAALALAPVPVILLSARKLGTECSSAWAQGGLAASLGHDDSVDFHARDTVMAGAGLCDLDIVQRVIEDGRNVIARLVDQHVMFDRDAHGQLCLGLEAAHSRHRIVHANGDGTGAVIIKALVEAVRSTPSIQILDHATAIDLVVQDGVRGLVIEQGGNLSTLISDRIVLATGGAGALWKKTTNPLGSWGCGLALAARAGAVLGDLEFMQFHPTAMDVGRDPMPLASEALRGEGAVLIDETGDRFMAGQGKAELEPRDVVARAIFGHQQKNHRVYLDARAAIGPSFSLRFPSIYAMCQMANIDPTRDPIPISTAAHYHMGGVVTDLNGRTSVKGLWACGEVACTGLHGANRLASNSLLEAASFGHRVAEDIRDAGFASSLMFMDNQTRFSGRVTPPHRVDSIREIMMRHVGVMRSASGLKMAINSLLPLAETSDMAMVGALIATAALRRTESRGAQARTDYVTSSPEWAHRQVLTMQDLFSEPLHKIATGA